MPRRAQKGFGLVEVLIGAAIITVGIVALIGSYTIYLNYAFANMGNVQAAFIAEEGLEAVTFIRDNSWTRYIAPLSTSTTYYLQFTNNLWWVTTTEQYVDSHFLRKLELDDVRRDAGGNVVASGGTYDPHSKLVIITIDYFQGKGTTTKSFSTYLTNLNNN